MLTYSPHIPRTRALLVALVCSLFFVASGVVQRAEASFSGGISAGKLTLNADGTDSKVALQLVKGDPTKLGIDLGADGSTDFVQSRSDFTSIVVSGGLGNDTVIVNDLNGVFTDTEQTTIDGGGGADTLLGGAGSETFIGRQGSDTIGGSGGADTFVWS